MKNNEREKMIVDVARLYYEEDFTQEQIAEKLQVSRPYVSKLLTLAKQKGIIQFKIVDPWRGESGLEKEFCDCFGLEQTIIVPCIPSDNYLNRVTSVAARYLNDILESGDIIASVWGETINSLSKNLIHRDDLSQLIYVQINGGVGSVSTVTHTVEISTRFSNALGCQSYLLQCPPMVQNYDVKRLLVEEQSIKQVLNYGKNADILLFTVGAAGFQNSMSKAGYLTASETTALLKKGAVGDLCGHMIDTNGHICDEELDRRFITLSLERIMKIRKRILIVASPKRIESVQAALNSKAMNVFISDEEMARKLLKLKKSESKPTT